MQRTHDPDFDLNLLRVFDALMTERHQTRAASRLGLSQSGMSHALTRLRAFYDDPLFNRGKGGMLPTPRAEELAPSIHALMETIRHEVLSRAVFSPRSARRTFSLCLTDLAELEFVSPLLRFFEENAHGCVLRTLQVPSKAMAEALESGDADLAIGALGNLPEILYQQLLFTSPFVTLVSKRNRRLPKALTLAQFEAAQHIVVDLNDPVHSSFDQVIEAAGIHRQIVLRTPHFLSVPLLLDAHPHMLATVPQALARQFARFDLVRELAPPVTLPRMALRQFWHPRHNSDPANVWLRGVIRRLFGDGPGAARG
ncbi:LysR family transcriptional regulator [Paraburkholderia sp. Ac-20347]|uniref:LysR family transcriptional regulator n=1 Tax=Paraburkholderia sp. Ac-20347 TaxID=2703892 RepID=UPI00197F9FD3|nr:LysR family transcriptional regulator [Paraburkholderia sp. Ac-20347]MBN3813741.1 LysR family transcriptional regulator [Paraburkholderia sp. Ac-20347]